MRRISLCAGSVLLVVMVTLALGMQSAGARTGLPGYAAPLRAPLQPTTDPRVRIRNFGFHPRTLDISRGQRVTWVNRDSVDHTSTSNSGLWDSGRIAPGDSFSRRFRRAGTFRYHCSIHTQMHGRIVVS